MSVRWGMLLCDVFNAVSPGYAVHHDRSHPRATLGIGLAQRGRRTQARSEHEAARYRRAILVGAQPQWV